MVNFILIEDGTGAGAANPPNRVEFVHKEDATTNTAQYTRIDMNNTQSGDYAIGTNLSCIGTD